ncbi:TPA: hypothetical protein OMS42_002061 [Enterobacter kobei]|nr:hypothetical protein [Enterobacter kobei]
MKVVKFGKIIGCDSGSVNVSNFVFQLDRPDENPNCAEDAIPAVINHLCTIWGVAEINTCADRESEIIVADAIEKARTAK